MPRPRKLLSIGHSYVVPLNRRLANEMQRLAGDRWEIACVAPSHFHGSRDLRSVAFQPDKHDLARVEAIDVRWTSRVHLFHYKRRLKRLMAEGWDVIHAWEEPFILAGAQLASYAPRDAALIYATFQNLPKTYPPPFNWFESYALNRAKGWIAFGNTVADALAGRPCYRARPMRLIPPGVDVQSFSPDPSARKQIHTQLGWSQVGPPVIGFLGRFIPEKGVKLLMEMIDALGDSCRALFVGAGPMEADLRQLQDRHPDRVRIATGVTHEQVPAYLCAMDILCAPSLTTPRWREQFGRMLVEGFASGLSVVGSDSGEIPYVIKDAGVVVPEGDVAAWVDAVRELIHSPMRRAELSGKGLDRARSVYAWPIVARQHLDFATELLDRAAPRRP